MKILDKLKNALFEEEYVEVEEKKDKKEKPIAKKIVLPETRRERREEAVFEEDEVKEELPKEEKKTFKFPAISEDDFVDIREKTPTRVEEKPKPVERREVPQDFHPAYPPYCCILPPSGRLHRHGYKQFSHFSLRHAFSSIYRSASAKAG